MTTLKEFNQKSKQLGQVKNKISKLEKLIRMGENTLSTDFYLDFCEKLKDRLEKWFDELKTVFVQAWIGSRKYYKEVVKIGKSYFNNREKMTKSNGWHCVTEIPEITEKMRNEMISDSYYY